MKIDRDNIQLCTDCMIAAVNDDYSGMNDEQKQATRKGLHSFGTCLLMNFDCESGEGYNEFSSQKCECCKTTLAGARYTFATLK